MKSLFTSFYLLGGLVSVYSTVQPDLSNLKSSVVADYDSYQFTAQNESNHLYYNHIIGNYTSTGRPYSAFYAIFNPTFFAFYPPVTEVKFVIFRFFIMY